MALPHELRWAPRHYARRRLWKLDSRIAVAAYRTAGVTREPDKETDGREYRAWGNDHRVGNVVIRLGTFPKLAEARRTVEGWLITQLDKWVATAAERDHWQEGYDAAEDGIPEGWCPYDEGERRERWLDGWGGGGSQRW